MVEMTPGSWGARWAGREKVVVKYARYVAERKSLLFLRALKPRLLCGARSLREPSARPT